MVANGDMELALAKVSAEGWCLDPLDTELLCPGEIVDLAVNRVRSELGLAPQPKDGPDLFELHKDD